MEIFPGAGEHLFAYQARPGLVERGPAVVVVHGADGLSEHYRDVTRRLAKCGYLGFCVDLLSRHGGTDAVAPNERAALLAAPGAAAQWVADCRAAVTHLRTVPFVCGDHIGIVGFGFGGGVAWGVACREPSLAAAVSFYGVPTCPAALRHVRAAVLGLYGALDRRAMATIEDVRRRLAAAPCVARLVVYPAAGRDFFDDTRPFTGRSGYVPAAAAAAWRDTVAWFDIHLGGPDGRSGAPSTRVNERPNWRRAPKSGARWRSLGAGPKSGPARSR